VWIDGLPKAEIQSLLQEVCEDARRQERDPGQEEASRVCEMRWMREAAPRSAQEKGEKAEAVSARSKPALWRQLLFRLHESSDQEEGKGIG